MTAYPHLFRPIKVGAHVLPNRIVMGSMHTGYEGMAGAEGKLAAFYAARAKGGAALVVTGGYGPNREGRMTAHPAYLATTEQAAALKPVARAVRAAGGRAILQLLHAGRYGYHDEIVAPSPIKSPINKTVPRALTGAEIERTIDDYAAAAALARDAGFDGVEIMASEGYLVSQFLSPRTNMREDAWGGAFVNRLRFPAEIVRRVRARTGADFLLIYRSSVLDLVEGGMTADEIGAVGRAVEAAGADMISTGIGWHEAPMPTITQAVPRGGFAWAAALLKAAVAIPVVASNRINAPETAERILAAGEADMVSMARALLADPDLPNKAKAGDRAGINICIACNQACLDHYFTFKPITCVVNPAGAREDEMALKPAERRRRVAVIGGGPAGLSAAAVAAERGHAVTLFEAQDRLGGQFNLAQRVPGKQEFAESVSYYAERLGRAGVDIRLGARADTEAIAAGGFEHVVVASGIAPRRLALPGAERPSVVSYVDVLAGRAAPGARVAVIGGGGIGYDVTLFLVERGSRAHLDPAAFNAYWGIDGRNRTPGGVAMPAAEHAPAHRITMLKRSPGPFGRTLGKTTGWVHRAVLARAGVRQIEGVTYKAVEPDGLRIVRADGREETIEADTIVVCAGQEPHCAVDVAALAAAGIGASVIGGARLATELDAKRAFEEGYRAAAAL